MVIRKVCPQCPSSRYKKNGHIHNGKQNHHCHDCGRQFVQCCEQYLISEDKRGLIERLLVERISSRGICRAVGVTLKWLLGFLVQCFATLPDHLPYGQKTRNQLDNSGYDPAIAHSAACILSTPSRILASREDRPNGGGQIHGLEDTADSLN